MGETNLDARFKFAVEYVQNLPSSGPLEQSNAEKLKFYALFKQATEGPCNKPKPGMFDIVNKYKWEAWKSLGSMSKDEAKHNYIAKIRKVTEEGAPSGAEKDEFLATLMGTGPSSNGKQQPPSNTTTNTTNTTNTTSTINTVNRDTLPTTQTEEQTSSRTSTTTTTTTSSSSSSSSPPPLPPLPRFTSTPPITPIPIISHSTDAHSTNGDLSPTTPTPDTVLLRSALLSSSNNNNNNNTDNTDNNNNNMNGISSIHTPASTTRTQPATGSLTYDNNDDSVITSTPAPSRNNQRPSSTTVDASDNEADVFCDSVEDSTLTTNGNLSFRPTSNQLTSTTTNTTNHTTANHHHTTPNHHTTNHTQTPTNHIASYTSPSPSSHNSQRDGDVVGSPTAVPVSELSQRVDELRGITAALQAQLVASSERMSRLEQRVTTSLSPEPQPRRPTVPLSTAVVIALASATVAAAFTTFLTRRNRR